jgi:hypothetical protein
MESFSLHRGQSLGVFAQGGKIAPALFDTGSDPTTQIHEVVLDEADDMKAVRNDASSREVALDEGAVACAHIDANDSHFMPAVQGFEEFFEVCRAFALCDIKDPMSFEITEGGGEATALVKGVFVNPEDLRALTRESLFGFTLSELLVDAFNCRGP